MEIEELVITASRASEPSPVSKISIKSGGVDPLGLRQINFELMDDVLPGLNNVADHLRPFIIMTWAWRRVRIALEKNNIPGATDVQIRDFVDRIDMIYTWSQFLHNQQAGIPGGKAIADLIVGPNDIYRFEGKAWEDRKEIRRTSTGLMSPLNYGPGLRSMGWLLPTSKANLYKPNPDLDSMLDKFEEGFAHELNHPAFCTLSPVEVAREDVRRWGLLWSIADLTDAERSAGYAKLTGSGADYRRREGMSLLEAAVKKLDDREDLSTLRNLMATPPEEWLTDTYLHPRARSWRRLQIRQLFRLSLESLFYWVFHQLKDRPLTTNEVSERFISQSTLSASGSAQEWLSEQIEANPVQQLNALEADLKTGQWHIIPAQVLKSIHCSLIAARLERWNHSDPIDRLPMTRALKEAEEWQKLSMQQFFGKIIEVWILAQHAYWCIGRGLADARGRGKTLMRLRIIMEEGGWSQTPGAELRGVPQSTPDRLQSAVSLLRECGRIT